MIRFVSRGIIGVVIWGICAPVLWAEAVFKIGDKTYTKAQVEKEQQGEFYELKKKEYDLIKSMAYQKYLDWYWKTEAEKAGKSVEDYKAEYFKKHARVSEKDVNALWDQHKDNPRLKASGNKEKQLDLVRNHLKDQAEQMVNQKIIQDALASGKLKIFVKEPKEPVYNIKISKEDHIRYGPDPDHTKPIKCSEDCPITVVEYSEFQCPYCGRVIPTTKRLLKEYQGKIRWVVRDFPLSFHDRARPAAVAAHCAGKQGKFWHMYSILFENQRALSDEDLKKYAKQIKGLNFNKWQACVKNPGPILAIIDKNMQSGMRYGVGGTPAFFVNGRSLSGAVPYESFKEIFEEELAKKESKS